MLAGTQLAYEVINKNTVAIVAGLGSSSEGEKSLWDRFRVAQVDPGQASNAASVAAAGESSQSTDRAKLEEVVVTAQKREERLIDTPQSVSVSVALRTPSVQVAT